MARASKLFLRFTGREEPTRDKVLHLIAIKYQVPVLGIRKVASGYNVIFELKADTDKILEPAATNDLKKLNLDVGFPQKSKPAVPSSADCRKIDASVSECSPEDIKNELQQK